MPVSSVISVIVTAVLGTIGAHFIVGWATTISWWFWLLVIPHFAITFLVSLLVWLICVSMQERRERRAFLSRRSNR